MRFEAPTLRTAQLPPICQGGILNHRWREAPTSEISVIRLDLAGHVFPVPEANVSARVRLCLQLRTSKHPSGPRRPGAGQWVVDASNLAVRQGRHGVGQLGLTVDAYKLRHVDQDAGCGSRVIGPGEASPRKTFPSGRQFKGKT